MAPLLESLVMSQDHDERMRERVHQIELDYTILKERAKTQEKRTDKIESNLSRVVWLVLTTIIAGTMTFIISGGFNVLP